MQLIIDISILFGLIFAIIAAGVALYTVWSMRADQLEDFDDEYGEPRN